MKNTNDNLSPELKEKLRLLTEKMERRDEIEKKQNEDDKKQAELFGSEFFQNNPPVGSIYTKDHLEERMKNYISRLFKYQEYEKILDIHKLMFNYNISAEEKNEELVFKVQ